MVTTKKLSWGERNFPGEKLILLKKRNTSFYTLYLYITFRGRENSLLTSGNENEVNEITPVAFTIKVLKQYAEALTTSPAHKSSCGVLGSVWREQPVNFKGSIFCPALLRKKRTHF